MICDTCRLSVRRIQTVDDYEDICAVADDPIARLDGSIGTEKEALNLWNERVKE